MSMRTVQAKAKTKHPDAALSDAQLGFFVGGAVGYPYRQEEIDRIRAFARAESRTVGDKNEAEARPYHRALEIIDAWAAKDEQGDVQRASDVERAHNWRQRKYDALAIELTLMKPATAEGVIAKAKALTLESSIWIDDEGNDEGELDINLRRFGPDEENIALSLVYDLLRLAVRR
jgi:hypothetical protein